MDLNRPRLKFFVSRSAGSKLVSGARRLPQPAAGPANGGGSEVLSVVPPGSSSEAPCSEWLRIDWNNRRALVRVAFC
jgi:hypothetical protein